MSARTRRPTPRGVPDTATPWQGSLAAPWYRVPPTGEPWSHEAERRARRRLGWIGAGAAVAMLLLLNDPPLPAATQPAAAPSVGAAAPASAVLASGRRPHQERRARFAAIDVALAAAVAGSQMAAAEAHDVALRAFAAQQASRYEAIRAELRALAAAPADGSAPVAMLTGGGAIRHAEQLRVLQEAEGRAFDLEYVRYALALNRTLLGELDAALGAIEDVELRDALSQMRGSIGGSMPAAAPAPID